MFAVSPIMDIPPELISQILVHSLSKPVILPLSGPNIQSKEPWNLTQVCSVWRKIAFRTPDLWNDVAVVSSHSTMNALRTSLSRSGSSLISIDIVVTPGISPAKDLKIFSIIKPYLGQLRHLALGPYHLLESFGLHGGAMGALESLSLSFSHIVGPTDIFPYNMNTFNAVHSLRKVSLIGCYSGDDLKLLHLPWNQLTHLHISNSIVRFAEGHAVLRGCTNLISCILEITPDYKHHGNVPETMLPNLESLTIHTHTSDANCGQFLQPFVLPSLKHLRLHDFAHSGSFSGQEPALLIRRSSCSLQHFEAVGLEPSTVSEILAAAPSLVELSLFIPKSASLDDLISDITQKGLIPNVHTLQCTLPFGGRFIDLVDKRLMPLLETIRVIDCHPERAEGRLQESVNRLRELGINVVFQDNGVIMDEFK